MKWLAVERERRQRRCKMFESVLCVYCVCWWTRELNESERLLALTDSAAYLAGWLLVLACIYMYVCACVYTGSEADLYQRVLTGCNRTLTLLLRWHRARRRDVELGPSQGLSDWDGRKCDEDRHSGMLSDEQRTNQPTNKHAAAYACVHPRYEICSALNWVCINLFGGHWFSGSVMYERK